MTAGSAAPLPSGGDAQFDLVTFGETMVRLSSPHGVRLTDSHSLGLTIGGAESNAAVALARLGRRVTWLSALAANPLGRRIEREIRSHGVDTSLVIWDADGRVGVYFLEPGADPRPARVYYDRAHSAVSRLGPDAFDTSVVANSRGLLLTGITPALSPGCAGISMRLAGVARDAAVPLIFDVNYRSRLWSPVQARAGLVSLVRQANLLICGAADAATIWGLDDEPARIVEQLFDLSDAETVVVTLGSKGVIAGTRAGQVVYQQAVAVKPVDPVGAGDAFAAGFLHVWLDDRTDVTSALRSATMMAALKMSLYGDHAEVELDELQFALAHFDSSTDIIR